jgi:hypothetical protein
MQHITEVQCITITISLLVSLEICGFSQAKQQSAGSLSKSIKQEIFSCCLKTDGRFSFGVIKTIRHVIRNTVKF